MRKRSSNLNPEDDFKSLEAHLAGALKPLAPPQEIVQRLNRRIQLPNRERIAASLSDWNRMFLVFAGVMSGMLILITLARAFYYLAGRRG
ncbi:MAG: hypothetical protein LDL50_02040 [Chloroflexi bacterium]|nr:hypothetical protein [Chloroflexota bacterium]MCA2001977.1 hypothetical protein [Chloroflexota bacterium]